MSVMSGSLIANGGAFGATPNSYVANVRDSGQVGFGPVLGNLDGNTPPVFLPLQFVVLHAPTIFQYIDGGIEIFKALMETHLISMTGLDFQYTMETDGTPVGRDGQVMMVPTKQVRSQITPTGTWSEKLGNLVFNFGRVWMNSMHDVDTQASSMAGLISANTPLPPHVASMYAADILAIQYDTTYRAENIIDAFVMTNFFPTDIGSPDYQHNVTETHRPDRSFNFHCIVQHNPNTVNVAKTVAELLGLHRINYADALPVANTIESNLLGEGMQHQVADILSQFRNTGN